MEQQPTSGPNQGELSLLEMIQSMKPIDTGGDPAERPPSSMAIALDEEKRRRQEGEKFIQQLQAQVYALQQDKLIADAAIQRKDSVLAQAQQHWRTIEADWKRKLKLVEEEKQLMSSSVAQLEDQLRMSAAESRKAVQEWQTTARKSEEAIRCLQSENSQLTEVNKQLESQVREMTRRSEESGKEASRASNKLDELKRENHRLKNQMEDLKREKAKLAVDLELSQERYDTSRQQWETHCQARIQETLQQAEADADRRLKTWQNEVESKLVHLVKTLEQQLGFLKAKNVEESQAQEARHQAEVAKLRALIQQQKKEYDDMTSHMRELAEAQWNTVNRVHHPSPAGSCRPLTPVVLVANGGSSDNASLASEPVHLKTAKREEMHQYVSQVIQRHVGGNNPAAGPAATNPALAAATHHRRKK